MADDLWTNDYSHAGKGTKARERLRTIEDVNAKTMNVARPKRKPTLQHKEKERPDTQGSYDPTHAVMSLKDQIRSATLDGLTYIEMRARFKDVTGLTIGNIRRETLETLKFFEREKLLDTGALARRRKKLKKGA